MSLILGLGVLTMRIFLMTFNRIAALVLAVFLVSMQLANAASCSELQEQLGADIISVHCGGAPSAAVDADGRLWVSFVQNKHVYVAHSDDKGATFSEAVRVNAEPEDAEFNGENRPKIVVSARVDTL